MDNLKRNLGSALMALSLLGFLYIYYPYIKEWIFPPNITDEKRQSTDFSIEIPSIKVFSRVIPDVDPFNDKEYLEILKSGVAHAKNSALPGSGETVYFFAHSSDVPWRITRYNTAFFKLDFLEKKDLIIVRMNGQTYEYEVFDKKTVWPSEVSFLVEPQGDVLILQTCTPIGTAFQRLLVFARPM